MGPSGPPPSNGSRRYRGYRVYAYITLARLFHALDLDLHQPDLLERAPARIVAPVETISKEEILHAIRSNSHMTEKVLRYLSDQGFATIGRAEAGYDVRITLEGVVHLRRYDALYREMYLHELEGHYRYSGPPRWMR